MWFRLEAPLALCFFYFSHLSHCICAFCFLSFNVSCPFCLWLPAVLTSNGNIQNCHHNAVWFWSRVHAGVPDLAAEEDRRSLGASERRAGGPESVRQRGTATQPSSVYDARILIRKL